MFRRRSLIGLVVAALVVLSGPAWADPGGHRARLSQDLERHLSAGDVATVDVIVSGSQDEITALATRYGVTPKRWLEKGAVLRVSTDALKSLSQDEAVAHLARHRQDAQRAFRQPRAVEGASEDQRRQRRLGRRLEHDRVAGQSVDSLLKIGGEGDVPHRQEMVVGDHSGTHQLLNHPSSFQVIGCQHQSAGCRKTAMGKGIEVFLEDLGMLEISET